MAHVTDNMNSTEAAKYFRGLGIVLRKDRSTGEFVVYHKGAPEVQWHFTDDLDDAKAVGVRLCSDSQGPKHYHRVMVEMITVFPNTAEEASKAVETAIERSLIETKELSCQPAKPLYAVVRALTEISSAPDSIQEDRLQWVPDDYMRAYGLSQHEANLLHSWVQGMLQSDLSTWKK